MKRDPAIHIRRSDLQEILSLSDHEVGMLMISAHKVNIRNRIVITAPAKTRKKLERTVQAEENVTVLFNTIYNGVTLANHIKTLPIKKNDPQYLTLKEISKQAYDFCVLFDLGQEDGFKLYVELGIKLLDRKFSIYRLKSASHKIADYYKNLQVIDEDETPDKTKEMYLIWQKVMLKCFGQNIKVGNVNQFVHFVYAKRDADVMGAKYDDWIEAQFDKWAFLNSAPEFSQLNGENAALVYQVYMGKTDKEYESDEEKNYFKKIKDETTITDKKSKQEEAVRKSRVQKSM